MKRFSAYASTILSIALLATAGCTGRNDSDQNAQPGAATPAAPATANTPTAAPPPPAMSPSSSTLPPASNTSPSSAPAPASTAAH